MGFPAHEGRPGAIGEVHARPHPLIEAPRVLVQLSFMTEGGSGVDHAVLTRIVAAARHRRARPSGPPPCDEVGQGHAALGAAHRILDLSLGRAARRRNGKALEDSPFGNGFSPPGTVISGIRLEIRKWTPRTKS